MRVFIGLPIPDVLKHEFHMIQKDVMKQSIKGHWTKSNNLHLTMLFIGDMNERDIEKLNEALSIELKGLPSFAIQTGDLGDFERENDYIVWVGIHKGIKKLSFLFNQIRETVQHLDIPYDDKPFKPHITLARQVRYEDNFSIKSIHITPHIMHVNQIHFYQSSSIDGELIYTPLYTYSLE